MFKKLMENEGMKMDKKGDAKLRMLERLSEMMSEQRGGNLVDGMKVGVMADDKKGLVEGLDKAKEVVSDMPMKESEEESEENEYSDEGSKDAKIAELEAKVAELEAALSEMKGE